MIDDIVEMILKVARGRDRKNLFKSVFCVLEDLIELLFPILFSDRINKRRKKDDENEG